MRRSRVSWWCRPSTAPPCPPVARPESPRCEARSPSSRRPSPRPARRSRFASPNAGSPYCLRGRARDTPSPVPPSTLDDLSELLEYMLTRLSQVQRGGGARMRFVLIHGGFHGAWCWRRTIPELEELGHEAVAIDLPGHGDRRDERSSLADRRDAIAAVLQPGDILVGHSGGGYDITLAADAAPDRIRHLIYLAAGLPLEGRTVLEATGGATTAGDGDGSDGEVTQLMTDET